MFCIKLAGIPIGIDNRYAYVRRLCAGYETAGRPAFTVRASEREIRAEQGGRTGPSRGYCESLCLYRQICRRLPFYDAFLMHASVVAVDGEAYAFAAPSGTARPPTPGFGCSSSAAGPRWSTGTSRCSGSWAARCMPAVPRGGARKGWAATSCVRCGRSAFWSRAPQTASVRWAG